VQYCVKCREIVRQSAGAESKGCTGLGPCSHSEKVVLKPFSSSAYITLLHVHSGISVTLACHEIQEARLDGLTTMSVSASARRIGCHHVHLAHSGKCSPPHSGTGCRSIAPDARRRHDGGRTLFSYAGPVAEGRDRGSHRIVPLRPTQLRNRDKKYF